MQVELESLRDALGLISGVVSCKVGIEANISPADYPLIRLVPVRATPGKPYNSRTIEVGIYFGVNVTESEGLETVYWQTLEMEGDIITTIQQQGGRYVETVTDEDRLDSYKLMFIRCEIQAARPVAS